MDYEFKKNTLDGSYHAVFSMGHEALGRWLIEEIGKDFARWIRYWHKLVH